MPWPGKMETLDDLRQWAAHHEGSVNAWWEQQWRWNRAVEKKLEDLAPLPGRVKQLEDDQDKILVEMEKMVKAMNKLTLGQAVHNVRVAFVTTALLLALTQGLPLLWRLLSRGG